MYCGAAISALTASLHTYSQQDEAESVANEWKSKHPIVGAVTLPLRPGRASNSNGGQRHLFYTDG